MSNLEKLQQWYRSQCNGDWEHGYGVTIESLDNPGWQLTINLTDTNLADKPFAALNCGVGQDSVSNGEDWLFCKVADKKFVAAGGPFKLEEMLSTFLKWAEGQSALSTQPTQTTQPTEPTQPTDQT